MTGPLASPAILWWRLIEARLARVQAILPWDLSGTIELRLNGSFGRSRPRQPPQLGLEYGEKRKPFNAISDVNRPLVAPSPDPLVPPQSVERPKVGATTLGPVDAHGNAARAQLSADAAALALQLGKQVDGEQAIQLAVDGALIGLTPAVLTPLQLRKLEESLRDLPLGRPHRSRPRSSASTRARRAPARPPASTWPAASSSASCSRPAPRTRPWPTRSRGASRRPWAARSPPRRWRP